MPDLIPLVMEAGQLLHGRAWMAPLARDLSVSDRTLQRWMTGAAEVPAGVRAELAALLRTQRVRIEQVMAALGESAATGEGCFQARFNQDGSLQGVTLWACDDGTGQIGLWQDGTPIFAQKRSPR